MFILVCWASLVVGYPPTSLYYIDATTRGKNIYSAFMAANTSSSGIYSLLSNQTTTEVALQTIGLIFKTNYTPSIPSYIQNGVISYVQNMIPAPNYTLFIVWYLPPTLNPNLTQYLVIPVEQITDVFYTSYNINKNPPIPTTGFTSTFSSNVLPLYAIDPANRAADIASVITTMIASSPYITQNPNSQVWIQTTLNGPFYPGINNGFIPDIQSISVFSGSLLLIQYLPLNSTIYGSVIISSEQIVQIFYYPNQPISSG